MAGRLNTGNGSLLLTLLKMMVPAIAVVCLVAFRGHSDELKELRDNQIEIRVDMAAIKTHLENIDTNIEAILTRAE